MPPTEAQQHALDTLRGDIPGANEGLMYRHSRNDQHPSRQGAILELDRQGV